MHVRYAVAIALLAGSAGLAVAQAVPPGDQPAVAGEETAPAAEGLSLTEVVAALEARGYTGFHEVEREDEGYYEVKARNRDGRLVEVHVSAETGEVIRSKDEEGEDD